MEKEEAAAGFEHLPGLGGPLLLPWGRQGRLAADSDSVFSEPGRGHRLSEHVLSAAAEGSGPSPSSLAPEPFRAPRSTGFRHGWPRRWHSIGLPKRASLSIYLHSLCPYTF